MIYVVLAIAALVVSYAVVLPVVALAIGITKLVVGLAIGITKLALNLRPTAKNPKALAPLAGKVTGIALYAGAIASYVRMDADGFCAALLA